MSNDLTKYSIFDGRYKYIYSFENASCVHETGYEELYDLKQDSKELNNILLERKSLKEHLKTQLFNHLSKYSLPIERNKDINAPSDFYKTVIDKLKSMGY